MAHFTENSQPLHIVSRAISDSSSLEQALEGFRGVIVLRLPVTKNSSNHGRLAGLQAAVRTVGERLGPEATLVVFGDVEDLVEAHTELAIRLNYHVWIAVRKSDEEPNDSKMSALPRRHLGLVVYAKYGGKLRHAKTRIYYTNCPHCGRTTKDYGGKRHLFHAQGTTVSDVWRDITVSRDNVSPVMDRLAAMFGIDEYSELRVCDLRGLLVEIEEDREPRAMGATTNESPALESDLMGGDCIEMLRQLPDGSVDFAFADPPYNLRKGYQGYSDDRADYLNWCGTWIDEVTRVLKPGGTFALLNIPLWATRNFSQMKRGLQFQNWIVWDALSFPVRQIMPAHYTILCFSKGDARPLPGLIDPERAVTSMSSLDQHQVLSSLKDGYCLRPACISQRQRKLIDDRVELTDVWTDIHRIKHNSRRVDHPSQLPPALMYRLIALFTYPGELVLDCFDGAGTTSLAAHQLGRRYLGIELSGEYHALAVQRHKEVDRGVDPFRKEHRQLTSKNSPVPRTVSHKYEVTKKALQLDILRIAQFLGRPPTRDEVETYTLYDFRFFADYFPSWSEAIAAVRPVRFSDRDGRPVTVSESAHINKDKPRARETSHD